MQLNGFRQSDWSTTIVRLYNLCMLTMPDPFLPPPPPTFKRKEKGRLCQTSCGLGGCLDHYG